jgi:spore coat protein CotH
MCNQLTNNMKLTLTSILIILLFHISCTNSIKQEHDLSREFFILLDSSNYTSIDFRELQNKDWDKMIVLTPYTNAQELRHNFKINIPREIKDIGMQYRDDISLILFVQDNSVIDYFTCPRTIDFSKINQLTGHTINNSTFRIEKTERKTIAGDQIYILE